MAASTEGRPDAAGPWEGGRDRVAPRLPSPTQGRRPGQGNPVDLIVLHSIGLPPGEFGGTAVQQLFTNRLDPQAHPYHQKLGGPQGSPPFFFTPHTHPQHL